MHTKIISLLITISSVSCATVPQTYLEADRATFEAIAPEYHNYVEQDATLTPAQKINRQQTIQSWRNRINTYTKNGE